MATLFIFPKKTKNAFKFPLFLYMRFYNKYDLLILMTPSKPYTNKSEGSFFS